MNLVQQSRINNVVEQEVRNSLLKQRWSEQILKHSPCLDQFQEATVIGNVARELNFTHLISSWVSDEDVEFGLELFSIVHNCPSLSVEAAQLSLFYEPLLINHSLTSVVAAAMHNIQPRGGGNIKDFTAVNMWYEKLDKRYNFSLQEVLTALSSEEQMMKLKLLDPPYLGGKNNDGSLRVKGIQYSSNVNCFNACMGIPIPTLINNNFNSAQIQVWQ